MKATDRKILIDRIRDIDGFTDEERATLIEFLSEKKYGLIWEETTEKVERKLARNYPILKEVKDHAIISDNTDAPNHVLIEGDNLEALTALIFTHEGCIDVIYIDPPYNTGNRDFKYNDTYVNPDNEFRHSMWLSFMSKRLEIAHKLLNPNGLIFISIDDNEQSALKILCDEIFGAHNFLNCVSIKTKASAGASGGGEDKKLKKNIEYLLIYSNNLSSADIRFPVTATPLLEYIENKKDQGITWSYTNVMTKQGAKHFIKTIKAGNGDDINIYEVIDYEIKSVGALANELNKTEEEIYNEYIDQIFTTENAQTSIRSRVADAVNGDGLYIAEYRPISGRNKGQTIEVGFIGNTKRLVSYLKNTCTITSKGIFKIEKIGTLWSDLSWSSVSREGGVPFPGGKKPISLIQRVIEMCPSKDCIVLDFFAGSGSTGHAVMNLNAEDGGRRKFIAVNNDEDNICDNITYSRISNVINGYGRKVGLHDNSLRYYRIDYVGCDNTQKNRRLLAEKATEMLCIKEDLYDEKNIFGSITLDPRGARYFDNGVNSMLIIYIPEFVHRFVEEIDKMTIERPIKIFVYSPGRYAYDDDFAIVADKVTLCAFPQNIIDAISRARSYEDIEVAEDNESKEKIMPQC